MDLFDIYFLSEERSAAVLDPSSCCRAGEIRIGSFRETFTSDTRFWSPEVYERQWLTAAEKIMAYERAAMITSLCDPASANFVGWWALYRDAGSIVIQQHIHFINELHEPFDPEKVEHHMMPRETVTEGGEPVSEWSTTTLAMADFLKRRS